MHAAKRKRLEAAGWRIGSAEDFLGLTKEETALVEMKLALPERSRRSESSIVSPRLRLRRG